jgi:Family of unknown function (DUF6131)
VSSAVSTAPGVVRPPPREETEYTDASEALMITLGVILLILGLIFEIGILYTIGIILLVVGLILAVLGTMGRAIGGRRHYY